MTGVEQKIRFAVGLTRRLWACGMVIATFYTLYNLPLWNALFLIPLGIISYLGSMVLMVILLQIQLTSSKPVDEDISMLHQLHADLESGALEKGSDEMVRRMHEAKLYEIAPISKLSENILGRFGDFPIYEWVQLTHPQTLETGVYFYHSPARYSPDGTPFIPDDDTGNTFVHVNGIIYAKKS